MNKKLTCDLFGKTSIKFDNRKWKSLIINNVLKVGQEAAFSHGET